MYKLRCKCYSSKGQERGNGLFQGSCASRGRFYGLSHRRCGVGASNTHTSLFYCASAKNFTQL